MDFKNYKVKFTKDSASLKNEESIIITNLRIGTWIQVDKYIYDYICEVIHKDYTIGEILDECEDEVTEKYFKDLIKSMYENEILYINEEKKIEQEKINEVSINLTNDCNLRCIHCSSMCGETEKYYLSFEQIDSIVKWCVKNHVEKIILTGGEIFLRKDIKEIILYIKGLYKGNLSIMTNGTLINEDLIEVIVNNIYDVNISLDGYDEESVTIIRGHGVFKKVMEVIEKLKAKDYNKISLSMVDTEITKDHIPEFKELCKTLGVKDMVRVLNPVGRAFENKDKLMIVKDKLYIDNDEIEDIRKNMSCKCICKAGKTTVSIAANGEVYPCEVLQTKEYLMGNILDLEKIKSIDIKPIVETVEECKNCDLKYFCSRGCMGMDYHMYNNNILREARCREIKESYNRAIWEY